jgi:hypothetical protein
MNVGSFVILHSNHSSYLWTNNDFFWPYFSYAARESPSYGDYRRSRFSSNSRSPTPEASGKVEFITSFGADSEDDSAKPDLGLGAGAGAKPGLKQRLKALHKEEDRVVMMGPMLPESNADKKSRSVHDRCFIHLKSGFISFFVLSPSQTVLAWRYEP